jgi:hypothetical protein
LAKEQLSPEELNKILLAQDNCRKTAWNAAEVRAKLEIVKDDEGNAVLYHTSLRGIVHVFERYTNGLKNN